jgi:hypothetical protein
MAPLPSNGKLAKIRPPSTLAMVAALSAVGLDLTARMSKYPPKRGSADYQRTGTLGRGWTMRGPSIKGQDLVVEVGNKVNYAGHVQGFIIKDPRQSKVMATLGWNTISAVGEEVVAEHRPLILKSMQPR